MCSAAFTDERIKIGDDIMARRSQPKDIPEDLRQSLVKLLTNFADELKQEDLRQKVRALVPAFHTLRDFSHSKIRSIFCTRSHHSLFKAISLYRH